MEWMQKQLKWKKKRKVEAAWKIERKYPKGSDVDYGSSRRFSFEVTFSSIDEAYLLVRYGKRRVILVTCIYVQIMIHHRGSILRNILYLDNIFVTRGIPRYHAVYVITHTFFHSSSLHASFPPTLPAVLFKRYIRNISSFWVPQQLCIIRNDDGSHDAIFVGRKLFPCRQCTRSFTLIIVSTCLVSSF